MTKAKRKPRYDLPKFVVPIYSAKANKEYRYFRHKLIGRVALKGVPGTEAFKAEYAACLERLRQASSEIGAGRHAAGGVRAVVAAYLASEDFAGLGAATQYQRRPMLLQYAETMGNDPIAKVTEAGLAHLFSTCTIVMQHAWRKTLRSLFKFAIAEKLTRTNPAAAWIIDPIPESKGSATWEDEHVEAYRKRWPSGTRERMALELLVNTAGRGGSDVVRLGRQNVKGGFLRFRASKNKAEVEVPILAPLRAEIAAMPAGQLLFIPTKSGGQMGGGGKSGNSTWTDFFKKACAAAGIPAGHTAHGLRKYTAVALTYAGCSDQEILAVLGDTDAKMLRTYTAGARNKIKTANAFARLEAHREGGAQIIPLKA